MLQNKARLYWHIIRMVRLAMGMLLLIGEESRTEVSGETERSIARNRPSLKGALERIGYHVVNVKDVATAPASPCEVPPDVIVLTGPVPDMELQDFCSAGRHDPAAEKSRSSSTALAGRLPGVLTAGDQRQPIVSRL